jgi:hypothetical protein
MKILALYTEYNFSILRRVKGPFSVLAERNHSFNLLQVKSFSTGLSFGSDITVLANWELSEEELGGLRSVIPHRAIVADCSDPRLLYNELYRKQLEVVSLVTVPNDWTRSAIHGINPRVVVVPSCVDLPYFVQANKVKIAKNQPLTIGCLGPYDWKLVKDALIAIAEKYPKVAICADQGSYPILRDVPRILGVQTSVYNLPEVMRHCGFGLCPYDGQSGWDDIWEYEYGSLCRPVIKLHPPISQNTGAWVARIEELTRDGALRSKLGNQAFIRANEQRTTKLASKYLAAYHKKLPQLFLA